MLIRALKLINFRNYNKLEIKFSKKINLIIAPNASGKSNFIESIFLLANTKSYKTNSDTELVNFNADNFYVAGNIETKNEDLFSEISFYNNKKIFKVNSDKVNSLSLFIKKFSSIIFEPDDIRILKDGPINRRRYINYILSKNYAGYLELLKNYIKLIKQKNKTLKLYLEKKCDYNLIKILNEQLKDMGSEILFFRLHFIYEYKVLVQKIFNRISGSNSIVNIEYLFSKSFGRYKKISLTEKSRLIEMLENNIKKFKNLEVKLKRTVIGPHLDDFYITLNDKSIKKFGSQGQQKSMILALKLAEAEFFKTKQEDCPVLLLDDIYAELDKKRRSFLTKYINENMYQVFITSTDNLNEFEIFDNKDYLKIFK